MVLRRLALVVPLLGGGCTASDDIHPPSIGAVMPTSGMAGTTITVIGSYFCAQPETPDEDPLACENVGAVTFGSVPGTIAQYTDMTILVEVPGVAPGPLDIHVSVSGRTSGGARFLVE